MSAPVLARPVPTAGPVASPLGWSERIVALVVTFLLAYNTPFVWANQVASPGGGFTTSERALGNGQMLPVLAAALLFVLLNLRCDITPLFRAAWREPLLLAFVSLAVTSVFWSEIPQQTIVQSLNLAVVAVLGYWIVLRFTLPEYVAVLAVAFGIGSVMHAFYIEFMGDRGASGQGWDGILYNRNEFGASAALAVLVFLVAARTFPRSRGLAYAAAALNLAFVIGSNSKTSLIVAIAMPVMLATFGMFRARRTLYPAVAIVMTTWATLVVAIGLGQLPRITESLDRGTDLSGRTEIWTQSVRLIRERPWLGFGWEGVWWDWSTPGAQIWKFFPFAPAAHSHNGLIEVMLQLGVVGGLLAVGIQLRFIVRGARVVRYYPGAIGMLPLVYAAYVLLTSVTEPGIYYRRANFLIFVVLLSSAARGRRDALPLLPAAPQASATILRRRL